MAEQNTQPIDSWDVDKAVAAARTVKEHNGVVPYGFQFSTRARNDDELDSKIVARSPFYYLGGKVETIAEVEARGDPEDRTLISNMKLNGWDKIIISTNSWKWTQPLRDDDVVLNVSL